MMKATLIKLLPVWAWFKKTIFILNTEPVILTSMAISLGNILTKAFWNKYFISDWEFVGYLAVAVAIDTLLGIWAAVKKNEVSSNGFAGLFAKVIIYVLLLVLINLLTSFTVKGQHPTQLDWADDVLYSGLLIREALSIVEKAGKIYPKIVPPWIAKKLADLNENGPK